MRVVLLKDEYGLQGGMFFAIGVPQRWEDWLYLLVVIAVPSGAFALLIWAIARRK